MIFDSNTMARRDLPDIYTQAQGHIQYQANPDSPLYKCYIPLRYAPEKRHKTTPSILYKGM